MCYPSSVVFPLTVNDRGNNMLVKWYYRGYYCLWWYFSCGFSDILTDTVLLLSKLLMWMQKHKNHSNGNIILVYLWLVWILSCHLIHGCQQSATVPDTTSKFPPFYNPSWIQPKHQHTPIQLFYVLPGGSNSHTLRKYFLKRKNSAAILISHGSPICHGWKNTRTMRVGKDDWGRVAESTNGGGMGRRSACGDAGLGASGHCHCLLLLLLHWWWNPINGIHQKSFGTFACTTIHDVLPNIVGDNFLPFKISILPHSCNKESSYQNWSVACKQRGKICNLHLRNFWEQVVGVHTSPLDRLQTVHFLQWRKADWPLLWWEGWCNSNYDGKGDDNDKDIFNICIDNNRDFHDENKEGYETKSADLWLKVSTNFRIRQSYWQFQHFKFDSWYSDELG